MKINDKIILYLDHQMSDEEKLRFEDELKNSKSLSEELENYKKFLGELNQLKSVEVADEYFEQMIPEFRGRIEERKRLRIFPKLALGVTMVTAVIVVFIFISTNKNINKEIVPVKTVNTQIANNQISSFLNNSSDQINLGYLTNEEAAKYDSVFNAMISNELDLSSQSMNYLSADNNTELSNMLQGINEKEADEIYNQLLHKKIY